MFIVNEADTEYRQLVRITRCQGAEEPCSNADIDSSYITKCVQVRQNCRQTQNQSPSPKSQFKVVWMGYIEIRRGVEEDPVLYEE